MGGIPLEGRIEASPVLLASLLSFALNLPCHTAVPVPDHWLWACIAFHYYFILNMLAAGCCLGLGVNHCLVLPCLCIGVFVGVSYLNALPCCFSLAMA